MNAIVKAGPDLDRLREARDLAAHCAALDAEYLPIFERLDAECEALEAAQVKDPVLLARIMAEQRRNGA